MACSWKHLKTDYKIFSVKAGKYEIRLPASNSKIYERGGGPFPKSACFQSENNAVPDEDEWKFSLKTDPSKEIIVKIIRGEGTSSNSTTVPNPNDPESSSKNFWDKTFWTDKRSIILCAVAGIQLLALLACACCKTKVSAISKSEPPQPYRHRGDRSPATSDSDELEDPRHHSPDETNEYPIPEPVVQKLVPGECQVHWAEPPPPPEPAPWDRILADERSFYSKSSKSGIHPGRAKLAIKVLKDMSDRFPKP